MKAISLWQPWASLIAAKIKPFETRHWAPPQKLIGQRIAIHASKKNSHDIREAVAFFFEELPGETNGTWKAVSQCHAGVNGDLVAEFDGYMLPVGCIICTAVLDSAHLIGEDGTVVSRMTSRDMPHCFTPKPDPYGDYSAGRWAWLLTDVQVVRPFAVKGRQGFFDVELPA